MEPLDVPCSYCGARPHKGCSSRNGKPRIYPHNARVVEASGILADTIHGPQPTDPQPLVAEWDRALEEASGHSDYDLDLQRAVLGDDDGLCGEHGENEPTCDYCGQGQCFTEHMEWNGETGCHVECEQADVPDFVAKGQGIVVVQTVVHPHGKPSIWLRIKEKLGI